MGPVNNFGTSRENREMGQDREWDNGYETAPNTALQISYTALHCIANHQNLLGFTSAAALHCNIDGRVCINVGKCGYTYMAKQCNLMGRLYCNVV